MAKQTHELQRAATLAGNELHPDSPFMQALGKSVWSDDPPFQTNVSQDESGDILANDLASPQGILRLTQKFGAQQVEQFKQELVKQGKLPASVLGNPQM